MFGGYGVYLDRTMFALVADNALYLKVDDDSRGEFEAAGLEPFRYWKKGKSYQMSYHAAHCPPPARTWSDRDRRRRRAN